MDRTLLVMVCAGIAGLQGCCTSDPSAPNEQSPQAVASAKKSRPPRCRVLGREQVLGPTSGHEGNLDKILPFATEVGVGVGFEGGFAVGALQQDGQGTESVLVTTNLDGTAWRVLSMGPSLGDANAPRVFARGNTLGTALLEPSGASRTLRVGRVDSQKVLWRAEYPQGHDESLAYDVVLGEQRGLAVWDDVPKDREVSAVYVAGFDPKTFERSGTTRVVTLPGTDAEMPRVVERPGGYWLFWLSRRPAPSKHDARYRAEDIAYRWIEVVPLDASGQLTGTPMRLGSDNGHVLAYDIASMPDGSVVVMWRDDDTPSGSAGGELMRVRVRLGGVDGPDPIEVDHVGVGAPNVMPGWFALADALGPTRLAPMSSDGSLVDELVGEATLGAGEPLANREDHLLISRPDGLAARLFVVRCGRQQVDAGATGG